MEGERITGSDNEGSFLPSTCSIQDVEDMTNPLGLAKRCLLGDGLIVPVEDAEDAEEAEEESSS